MRTPSTSATKTPWSPWDSDFWTLQKNSAWASARDGRAEVNPGISPGTLGVPGSGPNEGREPNTYGVERRYLASGPTEDECAFERRQMRVAAVSRGLAREQRPFDVAWRTIDGLKVR
jgi:hypothetical protein